MAAEGANPVRRSVRLAVDKETKLEREAAESQNNLLRPVHEIVQ